MTGTNKAEVLPKNLDAERFVLGSALLDAASYVDAAGVLLPDDFSLRQNQIIFRRMQDISDRGEHIDRVVIANELRRTGEYEACGGIEYIVSLDDGMPQIYNLDSYIRIIQEKATLRRAILSAQHLINRCMMASEDSQEILQDAELIISKLGEGRQKHGQWLNPGEIIQNYPGGPNAFFYPPHGGNGIPTPWGDITEKFCGLHPGDLFVVAGRPSMGKSLVGAQMCHHAAVKGFGAAIFSLEMSKESIVTRLICSEGRVDAHRLRAGYLNAEERERVAYAQAAISRLSFWIDDTRARTIPAISAALRKLRTRHEIKVVMIDHLQLMHAGGKRRGEVNRNQELGEICHSLKHLARDTDAVVILLSQLNRDCEKENRRPQQSDLRETGDIEQDADEIMFVHRPERYARNYGRPELKGIAEFIIAKQRDGQTGLKTMTFLDTIQKFESSATQMSDIED